MTTPGDQDRPKTNGAVSPRGARTTTTPTRFGRFVVDPGDGVAVRHLVEHHLLAGDVRQRVGLWGARRALRWGWDGLAGTALQAGYGRGPTGPLEVERVWSAVRDTLRACSLAGVRIRIHLLDDPVAGLGRGGVLFGFGRPGGAADRPVVVLKVRPAAAEVGSLAREAAGLRAVRGRLPDRLRPTLPEALAHRVSDGVEVLATSFVPGCPVHLHLRDGRPDHVAHGHLTAVTRWLADLQDACPPGRVVDGSTWPEEADGQPWGEELRERLARDPLPLLDSHGDFQARNVLCARGVVSGVVDWGRHRPDSVPTRDLFHFLITYARLGSRPSSRNGATRAFRRAFVERTRLSQAVRQALVRYGHLRGLDLPTLGGLFRMHLLLVDRGGGPRDPFASASEREAALRLLTTAGETVFTP